MSADALIVCGGWQPDLSLWHMAGGSSLWQSLRQRLEPVGNIDGIALAGSAAGQGNAVDVSDGFKTLAQ
ncbi:hypothetical protein [Devosia chinhatensis]|uniref:hypothetical protein n=1 Tax=Devosia chinhatensis TaxID=429727 RepID=UPI000A691CF4|nr:hypothetical protein [Devosia chinhatensis]